MVRRWMLMGSLVAAATFCAGTAQAADPEHYNNFEITPFAGYMAGGKFEDPQDGSDRELDADTSYGIIFNAAVEYWRHYEVLYVSQSTQIDGGDAPLDLDVQYLQIGGIVSYPDSQRVIPYFGLTVGASQLSPDAPGLDDETKLAFSVAAGMRIPVTDRIGIRLDARVFVTLLDTEGDIFCVSTGATGTCRISASGDTFLQYSANLGVIVGF